MDKLTTSSCTGSQWGARFFLIAGCFMFINVALLWIRMFTNYQLSILWPAIPAVTAFSFSVLGLFKLYPLARVETPLTAKSGLGFVFLAGISLSVVIVWIFALSVFGDGIPQPGPQGLLISIVLFMLAMVLAFVSNAVAFLKHKVRKIGYLLTAPVAMWALMLVVGVLQGMERGLSLDYYTNVVHAIAFLGLGYALRPTKKH